MSDGRTGCEGFRRLGPTRREALRAGTLAYTGLTLPALFAGRAASQPRPTSVGAGFGRARSCIMIFQWGGPSQLDTWDPKPDAPDAIRGPFKPIKTNVPGVEISENFPRMAKAADRYAILRSVHHKAAPIHETGCQMMQTGRLFRGGREHPHYGSVVSYLRG